MMNSNSRLLLGAFSLAVAGCAADLQHVPFDQKDRFCGQQCSKQYSVCQSEWTALAPYQSYRCGEDLENCVTACPSNTASATSNVTKLPEGT